MNAFAPLPSARVPLSGTTRRLSVAVLLLAVSACASAREAPDDTAPDVAGAHPALNATLWMQQSVEYEAAARQAYLLADRALDASLEDASGSALPRGERGADGGDRPPAVIVDVDETVLDNSAFQARLAVDGTEFDPERWGAWVREADAAAVPGALRFLRETRRRGVDVYYVTNRDHDLEAPTRRNLEALGFPLDAPGDPVLTRGEREAWGSDKASRRAAVARHHRVVLVVGDDLNDFLSVADAGPEERRAAAAEHEDRWGRTWIMLPNPAYGSWERAAWGHETGLSTAEQRARKLQTLDPGRDRP